MDRQPERVRGRVTEVQPTWVGVAGQLCPPAGRRASWLLFVPKCPACGYAHHHRADVFHEKYLRRPSCCPWLFYSVHARIVLPEAVAA